MGIWAVSPLSLPPQPALSCRHFALCTAATVAHTHTEGLHYAQPGPIETAYLRYLLVALVKFNQQQNKANLLSSIFSLPFAPTFLTSASQYLNTVAVSIPSSGSFIHFFP